MSKPLHILFKYPSRQRPERFFTSLDSIVNNLADMDNYTILCTLDVDDLLMNNDDVISRIAQYKNTVIDWGVSDSKVHAINRGIPTEGWDVICNHADDMVWQFYGFDNHLRKEFEQHGLDSLLHVPDQDAKLDLATMYIAGKPYFDKFGFVYNPVYKNLFCDNEVMILAQKSGNYKLANMDNMLLHLLPAYGHLPKDEMWIKQQESGWDEDMKLFYERQANNFYL